MASCLNEIEDEEEEDDEEDSEGDTELYCTCGDEEFIQIGEDVAIVHLVSPYLSIKGEIMYNILFLDEGEPVAEPLIFKYECWENVGQELAEAVEDQPPIEEASSLLDCDYCGSSVRMGELCASVHLGEVCVSEKLPPTTTFVCADDSPYVICLSCVRLMIGSEIDRFEGFQLWGNVSQKGECQVCTRARCWRAGVCVCKCHQIQG